MGCCDHGWVHIQHPMKPPGVIMMSRRCPNGCPGTAPRSTFVVAHEPIAAGKRGIVRYSIGAT